jgi:hypothetical protein
MQIHVARNGQMLGQHEADAIPALVQNGTILATDHYWHDGMAEWAPVASKWPVTAAANAAAATTLHVPTEPAATTAQDLAAIAQANRSIMSGARWFWWIAGLSAVNTILSHTGSDMSFVLGLGFTLIVDAIFHSLKIIAFAIDLLAIGFFFGVGWFAVKGRFWAFVVGLIAYAGDTVIYFFVQEWRSLIFHLIALFFIGRGAMALRADVREAKQAQTNPAPGVAQ